MQSYLSLAAGYLLRICKIRNKVKEKCSKVTHRSLQEVDQVDNILSSLDAYKDTLIWDLQVDYIPNEVD